MASDLFSEGKKRAASQCEKDQLRSNLEKAFAGKRKAEELVTKDQKKQQRAIDLYKRMKYKQGYEDHEHGKELRYPLNDDVEMVSENTKEEAFRDEEGSEEHEEDDDAKEVEEGEEEVEALRMKFRPVKWLKLRRTSKR